MRPGDLCTLRQTNEIVCIWYACQSARTKAGPVATLWACLLCVQRAAGAQDARREWRADLEWMGLPTRREQGGQGSGHAWAARRERRLREDERRQTRDASESLGSIRGWLSSLRPSGARHGRLRNASIPRFTPDFPRSQPPARRSHIGLPLLLTARRPRSHLPLTSSTEQPAFADMATQGRV